jgi:hypothetical protein
VTISSIPIAAAVVDHGRLGMRTYPIRDDGGVLFAFEVNAQLLAADSVASSARSTEY